MSRNKEVIEKNTTKAKETFWEQLTSTFMAIPVLIAFVGFLVFLYQCFLWLKNGHWTSLSASLILVKILPTRFLQWLVNESSSWFGVKKIIFGIFNLPLGLFLFLFGICLMLLICELPELFSNPKAKQKE